MTDLHIVWWNTNLTPPNGKASRGPAARRDEVAEALLQFVRNGASVVLLGEVDEEEALALANLTGLAFRNSTRRRLACFFRTRRTTIETRSDILEETALGHVHVAWRLELTRPGPPLSLFVVHWRSEMRHGFGELHGYCAANLRHEVSRVAGALVLGDFNEEPFGPNVTVGLESSRERDPVLRGKVRLYSPFWRLQGEPGVEQPPERGPGTRVSKKLGPELSYWKLVDFALVDRGVLTGEAGWTLDEVGCQILEERWNSDHQPIRLVLKQR